MVRASLHEVADGLRRFERVHHSERREQDRRRRLAFRARDQGIPALNILVNNAGVMRTINLRSEEQSLEELTREVDINFKGPVRMVKRFLSQLKKMPNAAIVNVSSGLAFVPLPSSPVCCATKAAMLAAPSGPRAASRRGRRHAGGGPLSLWTAGGSASSARSGIQLPHREAGRIRGAGAHHPQPDASRRSGGRLTLP
jgi:hypothetical protein